jgi:hypothetical protein
MAARVRGFDTWARSSWKPETRSSVINSRATEFHDLGLQIDGRLVEDVEAHKGLLATDPAHCGRTRDAEVCG